MDVLLGFYGRMKEITQNVQFAFKMLLPSGIVEIRGPFAKVVDWWQCAAVVQREAVTVMPSCSGEGNVVVA
jgi:hypothetical protein